MSETYTPPEPPAPLVPAEELDDLVLAVTTALTAEVQGDGARDADKLDRAVRAAIEVVETHLDLEESYDDATVLPVRVMKALIDLGAGELRRPGFAYGLAGYDEADPMAVRAYGAILAGLTPGLKARWGIA